MMAAARPFGGAETAARLFSKLKISALARISQKLSYTMKFGQINDIYSRWSIEIFIDYNIWERKSGHNEADLGNDDEKLV